MTTAVSFQRLDNRYLPRFAYDPDLVAVAKTVPSYARSWNPDAKEWPVHATYAPAVGSGHEVGCLVTGLEPEPGTNPTRERGTQ